MTRHDFWEFINRPGVIRQTYIVSIRMKYTTFDKWEYSNELLLVDNRENGDPSSFIWENDWYEGQGYVEILGYMSIGDVEVPETLNKTCCLWDYRKGCCKVGNSECPDNDSCAYFD